MNYQNELEFFLRFLKNRNINTHFYTRDTDIKSIDLHLRQLLGCEEEYQQLKKLISRRSSHNTIYKFTDQFYCIYYLIDLPSGGNGDALIIGPHIQARFDSTVLLSNLEQYAITPSSFQMIQEIFSKVPVILEDTLLDTLLQTLGETIWGDREQFHFQMINNSMESPHFHLLPHSMEEQTLSFETQVLEFYLNQENSLIQAVSQGNTAKAEDLLSIIHAFPLANGGPDILRNMKNFAMSLNTLLRKTSELNTINPHSLMVVYMKFYQKIEECTSPDTCIFVTKEMIRKYCILVKNQSMKEYSLLIQQAVKQIDMDLTADLSLHAMAKKLNSNASYLSTQFKKVTGTTYTEYVQRKRIDHSLFLLNTTSLQIQTIAQYCGIPDLNYFSKLFKKYVHHSPSSYRKEIRKLDK